MFEKVYSKVKGHYFNKICLNKSGNLVFSRALALHCGWVEILIDKDKKLFGLKFKTEKEPGDFKLMDHGASLFAVGFAGILKQYHLPNGGLTVDYQNDLDNHLTIFSYNDLYRNQPTAKEASLKIVTTKGRKK